MSAARNARICETISSVVTDSLSPSGVVVCRRKRADSPMQLCGIGCSKYSRLYFSRSRASGRAASGV
jgi:hypothetical protein